MNHRQTTLERAYELARSGECAGVGEIKARLKAEHFSDIDGQLFGRVIGAALRRLCEEARATSQTA